MKGHDLELLAHLTRERISAISIFRPMPSQERVLRSKASEILVRGGNRAGKSIIAAVRFAAIALGKKITLRDGTQVDPRLPWQRGRSLLMWVIGVQINHSPTIHRLLFRSGLFKMIRDRRTRLWRAWDPLDPDDASREDECKPSPPLIPQSEIDGTIGWVRRAAYEWDTVTLKHDGTILKYYPSTGHPKQGDAVDEEWIDERIEDAAHYPEYIMRLSDTKGRLLWSSKPYTTNYAQMDLTARAERHAEEVASGQRNLADVEEIVLTFSGNPYIDQNEKNKRLDGLSDDERRARDLGEYILDNVLIYPSFSPKLHCAWGDYPETDDDLAEVLRARGGEPPDDWTRELILDPGTAFPCVLLCAVPPQKFWLSPDLPYFVVYKELYRRQQTADMLARLVRDATRGYHFQRFIIDKKGSDPTPMGFSVTIADNYSRAFAQHGLACAETRSRFTPGDPNFITRSQAVERWLQVRDNGRAQLRIVVQNCPGLVKQMMTNVKSCQGDAVLDKPNPRQQQDARVALEYWASRNPLYVRPGKHVPGEVSGIDDYILKLFQPDGTDDYVNVGAGRHKRMFA